MTGSHPPVYKTSLYPYHSVQHLYACPLVTPEYGADSKTGVRGTFLSIPHGGPKKNADQGPRRVVLTLYVESAFAKGWAARPTQDNKVRMQLRAEDRGT